MTKSKNPELSKFLKEVGDPDGKELFDIGAEQYFDGWSDEHPDEASLQRLGSISRVALGHALQAKEREAEQRADSVTRGENSRDMRFGGREAEYRERREVMAQELIAEREQANGRPYNSASEAARFVLAEFNKRDAILREEYDAQPKPISQDRLRKFISGLG